ncbi:guanylate kinase [Pseudalkalibacillus decolorationis]|uniref:guanylate kinase n=1 Tax=Pseudalkalibacillus decolorationis TaxID=163879 RepID=UPI002147DCE7|nr:guanylate kinase [Pseudalkalibacillus decolorationis]
MKKERGILFVLSGPSGVGKGTVNRALRQQWNGLEYSISVTTRQPREGERDGVDYFFTRKEEFETMIEQNQLLEWAEYVGNYYGTPLKYVEETLQSGNDVLLEIEVQGAMQVRKLLPEGVFIFLVPPSLDELRNRIVGRGTETNDLIENRMSVAKEELEMMDHYDYVVENDEIQLACDRIKSIAIAEHCKKDRIKKQYLRLLEVE